MRHTISVLVENKFGVLTRIAGLFSGRGYNIDTLNVAPTHDADTSKMTIVTRGDDATVDQIANAVIHEIGHAKSNLDEEMHDQNPKGILARDGGSPGRVFLASDARWMATHLPKNLVFNMKFFSAGPSR